MVHTKAEILINQMIAPDHFKMVLRLKDFRGSVKPGQFFHIRAGSDYDPLLRRPLSIHRIGNSTDIIEILYKVVGKGTQLMSRRSKDTYLDVIGPLGNGFKIAKRQRNFIIVAGGMGVAPLLGLCDELAKFRKKNIAVILGAKTADYIVCEKEFRDLKATVLVATEDGSRGVKGLVTDVLADTIKRFDLRETGIKLGAKNTSELTIANYQPGATLYTCGCKAMLEQVAKICRRYNLEAQASLEERMGCGLGACMGCVVNTVSGYKRVCKDGPVFELGEIIF
ncbi:MAG: dihydroorotate dehydrogenase electron transfer subunit [Candidatus Omnitrophica bacterium]|nr:dihydroorotate dehydrogenase electron transfer subunit [Candidatus Omnitrophota bacterium]